MIKEKKELRDKFLTSERELKEAKHALDKADNLNGSKQDRYEEAVKKITELQNEIKEMEENASRRIDQINNIMNENLSLKDNLRKINNKFGNYDEINDTISIA